MRELMEPGFPKDSIDIWNHPLFDYKFMNIDSIKDVSIFRALPHEDVLLNFEKMMKERIKHHHNHH